MLHINDLTHRIGGRLLFDGASMALARGHRVGLVGRNGSGKTTLLHLITGEVQADGGTVSVRKGTRIGRVAQDAPDGPDSLLDTVLAADGERAALLAEADVADDPARIADIHTRLADIEAHAAPARAASILAGLGFDDSAQARPCAGFSGGWRMRVALAAALFARPDLLLLDEPTNHLDLEATLWLESYLAGWDGTLLVVSHERTLLNRVVSATVSLEGRRLVRYAGGYDRFERTRRERLENQGRTRRRQQAERRHIQAFVDRFRAQATKARQAQSRLRMLARMEPIASVVEERTAPFRFPVPAPLAPPAIVLDGAAVGYDAGPHVLDGLDLRIDMNDRIALLGANGNGKSTLVKLLVGRLEVDSGRLRRHPKLRLGYFAQHQAEELDGTASPYLLAHRRMDEAPEAKVRAHLGAFGFDRETADARVATLSGGERARLLFALMSLDAPHLMLLDEPTNHLDVDSREALAQALNDFDGGVVLVSHDPHLIELVCDRLWLVADGTCVPFDGDLEAYREALLAERRAERATGRASADGRKGGRRARARTRAETARLRTAGRDAERRVDDLSREKQALEARLAAPETYDGPTAALAELQIGLARIEADLAEAERAWIETHEALDKAG